MVRDRRALMLVRVGNHELHHAASYFCTAKKHGGHSILFVADSEHGRSVLAAWGLPAYHDPIIGKDPKSSPLVAFLEVARQTIAKGYHVVLGNLKYVLAGTLEALTATSADPKPDVMTVADPLNRRTELLFVCSRGKTMSLWLELIGAVERQLDQLGQQLAPGSWRETAVLETAWQEAERKIAAAPPGSYTASVGRFAKGTVQGVTQGAQQQTTKGSASAPVVWELIAGGGYEYEGLDELARAETPPFYANGPEIACTVESQLKKKNTKE